MKLADHIYNKMNDSHSLQLMGRNLSLIEPLMDCMSDYDCLRLEGNLSLMDLMMTISVTNECIWGECQGVWLAFFYLYVVIFVVLFCILIAFSSYVVTQRNRAERQKLKKVNTFYAINSMIILLGVLRVAHLIFDPNYVEGWLHGRVPHIIISLIFSMGFPSLTASYLLVFISFLMSRKINGSCGWILKTSILVPLCAFQYVVTFSVELIALSNNYKFIYLVVACELFFCLWGITICLLFLVAGCLLLKSIEAANRTSVDEERNTDKELQHRRITQTIRLKLRRSTWSYKQKQGIEHRQRAMIKVTILTGASAILGILYSILSIITAVLLLDLLLQKDCVNQAKGNRASWLFIQYLARSLELLLCFLLLFAVADTTKLMKYLFKKLTKCNKLNDNANDDEQIVMSDINSDASSYARTSVSSLDDGVILQAPSDSIQPPISQLPLVTEETPVETFRKLCIENGTCSSEKESSGKSHTHDQLSNSLQIRKDGGPLISKRSKSDSNIAAGVCLTAYQPYN